MCEFRPCRSVALVSKPAAVVDHSGCAATAPVGYGTYVAIPGVIHIVDGLGAEDPAGGAWAGIMLLTHMFALTGIQVSPAFSMWTFSNRYTAGPRTVRMSRRGRATRL